MQAPQYNDEPPRAFQSNDREPMDYSKGPHDRILGETVEDRQAEEPDLPTAPPRRS
jgi:hypothetical protein